MRREEGHGTSPRLGALQEAIAVGKNGVLDAFWREIAMQGTPLIEPIADDAGHWLVTFLWRGDAATTHVDVIAGVLGDGFAAPYSLSRLSGSDVWYRTDRAAADMRNTYMLAPNQPQDGTLQARMASWQTDPYNSKQFAFPPDPTNPEAPATVRSIVELPRAPDQPWITSRPDVPKGRLEALRFTSIVLKNERTIWVYIPAGYRGESTIPMVLLFDGLEYQRQVPAPTILDNLIADNRIPPVMAILIESPDPLTRMRELVCRPPIVTFLAEELLPWLRHRYQVVVDPARTIVGGSSLGGLASAYVALERPDLFGAVLAQSGSFWWKPSGDDEFEWLARRVAALPLQAVRFYLEVDKLESAAGAPAGSHSPARILSNRHLRTVPRARGYAVQYQEFNGGHEWICWRGSLAEGLMALLAPTL